MADSLEEPRAITIADEPLPRALRKRVAALLGAEQLVVLPTETVYGLAARADSPRALARLAALKGSEDTRGWTWHVSSRDAVERFDSLRPLARRLAARYWPGPLTLVLSGVPQGLEHIALEGRTGVRLPAHRATQSVIEQVDFPLVLSSVNRAGEGPLIDATAIVKRFGDDVELILDGGPSRLAESSGVLRLAPGDFTLLREGLLPLDDLRRVAGLRIAFACTGNTCRSPMAEGLARALLAERLGVPKEPAKIADFGFAVDSMGVFANPGAPASEHAVEIMSARGIDITAHRAQGAAAERVAERDLVFCLTHSHLQALREALPPGRARHVHLLDPEGEDVPDPIGGSRADYERCARHIQTAIERRAADWA